MHQVFSRSERFTSHTLHTPYPYKEFNESFTVLTVLCGRMFGSSKLGFNLKVVESQWVQREPLYAMRGWCLVLLPGNNGSSGKQRN